MMRSTLVFLVCLFFAALFAAGDDASILVVKNKNSLPYRLAIQGIKQALDHEVVVFHLEGESSIQQLQASKPAVIITLGTTVTRIVSRHFPDTPIVYTMVVDPMGSGITTENTCGVSLDIPFGKQLGLLKQTVPNLKTVGTFYNPGENSHVITPLRAAAGKLNLDIKAVPVTKTGDIPDLNSLGIQALLIIPDNTVCQPAVIKNILLSGLKNRIPIMGISPLYVEAGALLAVSGDYKDIGQQAGERAARILDRPRERRDPDKITPPRKFKLYINIAVAQRLGIRFPEQMVQQADKIYGK